LLKKNALFLIADQLQRLEKAGMFPALIWLRTVLGETLSAFATSATVSAVMSPLLSDCSCTVCTDNPCLSRGDGYRRSTGTPSDVRVTDRLRIDHEFDCLPQIVNYFANHARGPIIAASRGSIAATPPDSNFFLA
jgi:hypothetical protein